MTDAERFWAKVDKTDGCWLWTSNISTAGYGLFKIAQRGYVAHILAYETLVGSVPDGLELDHLCKVRRCVNPEHLEPVTQRENIMRANGFAALNARKDACPNGHAYDAKNPRGSRICTVCKSAYDRERYVARKR